jgi:3-methyladenine DNA glycosylase/8-oxoguanine DNA glycosylase
VLDPWRTLGPLRHGIGDPTIRLEPRAIWRAMRTDQGPATVLLEPGRDAIAIRAWGEGHEAAIAAVPRLLGAEDDPGAFRPQQGLIAELARRFRGVRFGRTDAVLGSLVPAICEQKVTGDEAKRAWRALVRRHGEPAPGPGGLWLAPTADTLARLPYWAYHPAGLERRRADVIRRVAARASWLEGARGLPPILAMERLRSIPGVGPWTAAETARSAFGDPDAVSVGDYHLPSLVSWVLVGEPRGDDARMLELLAPYAGQRARVVRLLELSGIMAPRYGPRMAPRRIAAM